MAELVDVVAELGGVVDIHHHDRDGCGRGQGYGEAVVLDFDRGGESLEHVVVDGKLLQENLPTAARTSSVRNISTVRTSSVRKIRAVRPT